MLILIIYLNLHALYILFKPSSEYGFPYFFKGSHIIINNNNRPATVNMTLNDSLRLSKCKDTIFYKPYTTSES